MITREECPICGTADTTSIALRDFQGMRSIVPFASYELLQCRSCGMMFAGRMEKSMDLLAYYEMLSKYETKAFSEASEAWTEYHIVASLLQKFVPKSSKILDLGCGNGNLLTVLQKAGYQDLMGVDPSKKNCEKITELHGIPAHEGALGGDISFLPRHQYDLVILTGVLEHILPLRQALDEIVTLLSPQGMIFIAVPDIGAFPSVHDFYQELSVEHVNYFSRGSLTQLFSRIGFSCIEYSLAGDGSYSLWQKPEHAVPLPEIDLCDAERMSQYLRQADEVGKQIAARIEPFADQQYYIWGTGTHTAMLFQKKYVHPHNVLGFVDSNQNYAGHIIYGKEIFGPEELKRRPKAPILISSQYAQQSIKEQIRSMGISQPVICLYD